MDDRNATTTTLPRLLPLPASPPLLYPHVLLARLTPPFALDARDSPAASPPGSAERIARVPRRPRRLAKSIVPRHPSRMAMLCLKNGLRRRRSRQTRKVRTMVERRPFFGRKTRTPPIRRTERRPPSLSTPTGPSATPAIRGRTPPPSSPRERREACLAQICANEASPSIPRTSARLQRPPTTRPRSRSPLPTSLSTPIPSRTSRLPSRGVRRCTARSGTSTARRRGGSWRER